MPHRQPLPSWYDDLDGTRAAAWQLLARGAADRRSGFHHPVISNLGLDGRPRSRVMILRHVDIAARTLRLHTDMRSEKIGEFAADPRVAMIGYDAGDKAQIRIEGVARLHHDDAIADAAWAASQRMSRACYGTNPAPGSVLDAGGDFALPDAQNDEALAAGRANFAALVITTMRMEWLYLAFEGHRRARFIWDETGAATSEWLVP